MNIEVVQIRTHTKRNALTLTFLGVFGLALGLGMFLSASGLFAPGMLCFALGAISAVLGISKLIEPEVSVELNQEGLLYHHRRGSLFIAWNNVQRFDIPKGVDGIDMIELPFIGIKLKQINPVLDVIPGRLATGLLTEQRPLLMSAVTLDENLEELESYMNSEFTPLVVNEERYRGVLAMFGHRCEMLSKNLGYHIYIPFDCLDRPSDEFISLLRSYLLQVREIRE